MVRYNEDKAPIGENGAKLKSFIGSTTHYHVPITYTSWKSVPPELKDKIFTIVEAAFVIDPRSRKNILQTAGISFRQFKNWLTTKYIILHKDEPQLLQVPPEKYSFIEQNHWEEFVSSRLSETFQCPLQVGSTTCGYYVMKYMREIVNRGSIVISDSIDTRKSYSHAELDEVRVELVEFLGFVHMI
ncbi:putative serine/threonine-protein kinase nek2 [Cucumis melo var. makuwa]|uniref:Serine/threonine-protein kinase nek2 n=1 Tax=Cucumis melo var. makuwa TaxID=1194695 RepID=A0A5D3DIF6_CUCMM|nr:putative serine/threonine-protein kinase nek2 [Cucumis melo var. makuwa]TYK23373.1 putative serine/threonine-protein kinase nek2 [Cucumis melo var. makuwa]